MPGFHILAIAGTLTNTYVTKAINVVPLIWYAYPLHCHCLCESH